MTLKCLCWDTYLLLEDCLETLFIPYIFIPIKENPASSNDLSYGEVTVADGFQLPTGSWDVASLGKRLVGVSFLNPFVFELQHQVQEHATSRCSTRRMRRSLVKEMRRAGLSCLNMHFILFKTVIKPFKKECCSNHVSSSYRMIFRYHIDMLSASFQKTNYSLMRRLRLRSCPWMFSSSGFWSPNSSWC